MRSSVVNEKIAATITLDDLSAYFKNGGESPYKQERWHSNVLEDGGFRAWSSTFEVEMVPHGASFHVSVEAYDDPSDSDETVTDEPAAFIVDFLRTGSAADEVFTKMAGLGRSDEMRPSELSRWLRRIAHGVSAGLIGRPECVSQIRQASRLVCRGQPAVPASQTGRQATGRESVELHEMAQLQAKMRERGWRSRVREGAHGLPEMDVDVAGVYGVKVQVDHVLWEYKFQLTDQPSSEEVGVTDDPIESFESFCKNLSYDDTYPNMTRRAGRHGAGATLRRRA